MKKKSNVLIIIIALIVAILAGLFYYAVFYLPDSRMSSNYVEFYQEYVADEYHTISINAINHDIDIRVSEDNLIHVSFFQHIDNANTYLAENGSIVINIIEELKNSDIIFSSSFQKLKSITISLPESQLYSLQNKTVSGDISLDGVKLTRFKNESVSGKTEIRNCAIGTIEINANSGSFQCDECEAGAIDAVSVTGDIVITLPMALENYNADFFTRYGTLTFNDERVTVTGENGIMEITDYKQMIEVENTIKLSSLRGRIALSFPES